MGTIRFGRTLIGGFLVDQLSWHWVFFVNVPLGILVALFVWFGYHEKGVRQPQLIIDWFGIIWLAVFLIGLLLAIQFIDTRPLTALGLFLVAFVGLGLLFRQERRFADPLMSPKMFRSKTFTIQIVTAMILSGVLIGYQVYFPIWLQSLYHVSATGAGLVVTSSSIMWLLASFAVGTWLQNLSLSGLRLVSLAFC